MAQDLRSPRADTFHCTPDDVAETPMPLLCFGQRRVAQLTCELSALHSCVSRYVLLPLHCNSWGAKEVHTRRYVPLSLFAYSVVHARRVAEGGGARGGGGGGVNRFTVRVLKFSRLWQLAVLFPGDAIAICMPMTSHAVSIYLGIVWAGCCVVGVADSFSKARATPF